MSNDQEKSLLRKAYRVAKKEGYILTKSRRAISPQNCGGLMLIDPSTNAPLIGFNYDATPEEVLTYFGNAGKAEGDRGTTAPTDEDPIDDDDPY